MDLSINEKTIKVEQWSERQGTWSLTQTVGIKITHVPTGVEVSCSEHRSQHKNKHVAMQNLKAELSKYADQLGLLAPHDLPDTPKLADPEPEEATAVHILLAYPGNEASIQELEVWETMRDLVIDDFMRRQK